MAGVLIHHELRPFVGLMLHLCIVCMSLCLYDDEMLNQHSEVFHQMLPTWTITHIIAVSILSCILYCCKYYFNS